MIERFANSDTIWLKLDTAGTGPELLFIGGTGWDLRAPPLPLQSPLIEHFTVALYDQRGMGCSDTPPGPYTMADYARDAIAIMDTLGWARPHVVGYSFGGMVAQELATTYPDRVNKLVLAATSSGGAGGSSFRVDRLLHLDPYERALEGLKIADLRFTDTFRAKHPEAADAMVTRRMKAQTRFMDEPGAREGLHAQLAARATHDCFDRLPLITADTLVLGGKQDGQAPEHLQVTLAERIPGATRRMVEGGHNFIFENDTAYGEIIDFLRMPARTH